MVEFDACKEVRIAGDIGDSEIGQFRFRKHHHSPRNRQTWIMPPGAPRRVRIRRLMSPRWPETDGTIASGETAPQRKLLDRSAYTARRFFGRGGCLDRKKSL